MKASRYGYMGPEFKAMYDVGVIICSRYLRNVPILLKKFYRRTSACKIDHPVATKLHGMATLESPALTETYWSVENNKKAILSDEFRLRQGYRKVTGLLSWGNATWW